MQYLEAKNNKQSLEKRLETLQSQLDMAIIKAPFSGVIDEVMPNVGEMASPGMPLIRLVNLNNIYIKADISERHLGTVTKGTKAIIDFSPLDITIDTTITRTGNYINPGNRTFSARIDLKNQGNMIKPNLMAKLKIRDLARDSVIVLSSDVIQQTPTGESFVYVASGKSGDVRVEKRNIVIGKSNSNDETLVLEGLKPGEVIVDRGSRSIKAGQEVTVVQK
jgi:RND family efflux transporter MFP subunit